MSEKQNKQINDDIDFFELFALLWKEKILIFAITVVFTLVGLGVVLIIPQTYEAKVNVLPLNLSNNIELKKFNAIGSSPGNSFSEFSSILQSKQLLSNFLAQEGVMKSLFEEEISQQNAMNALNKIIKFERPKKEVVFLKLKFKDENLSAKYANQLIELAIDQYRMNIASDFDSKKRLKINELNNKKSSLIASNNVRLNEEIYKLKEAYLIAEKLNIIDSRELTIPINISPSLTEELRYLYSQGTLAINAEIEALIQRKTNLSSTQELVKLDQSLSVVNSTSFDANKVLPVNIGPATTYLIKPKRILAVGLSAAIGGILAIVFVLIRNGVRNRKFNI